MSHEEAEAKAAQVEYLLLRLKQRLIELPPGIGIVDFLPHDGKPPAGMSETPAESQILTFTDFQNRYLAVHQNSLGGRTVEGIELHFKHLIAAIGERFPISKLMLIADLRPMGCPRQEQPYCSHILSVRKVMSAELGF